MAQNDLDLAALVSSRICHDLISPIGAINNGLELLNMSGASPVGPEMQLICDSVKSASARIRFFRIAFGAASDEPVVRNEVTSILTEMFDGGRLAVEWGPVDIQTRKAVRCAFLTILCLETAMPFGGQIRVLAADLRGKLLESQTNFLILMFFGMKVHCLTHRQRCLQHMYSFQC